MPLNIESFEKDIIVDEVILQNKEEYLLKDVGLSLVKDLVNHYLDEYLSKSSKEIGFNEALGSALNIGKLIINAAAKGGECLAAINSSIWDPEKKYEFLNKKYQEEEIDLTDEIYAKSVFSVVPNYVMEPLSFIKHRLLKTKKDFLYESGANIHRISRVIELYLDGYNSSINPAVGFRLMSEADLFSVGNLYLNFIEYIIKTSLTSTFNHQAYTLVEFTNKKDVFVNDILYFINSFDKVNEFNSLPLISQVEISKFYHWLPTEIFELQNIGKKLLQIVNNKTENPAFRINDSECYVLKARIEDSIEKFRITLYNNHKKYYNVGIDLGGEYVFEVMREIIRVIDTDLKCICNDDKPSIINRNCLYYGDQSFIEGLFTGSSSIMSILEANNKGE